MGSALLWRFATICPRMDGIRAMQEQRSGVPRHRTQTMAICCEARLALKADRPTEPSKPMLLEYQALKVH